MNQNRHLDENLAGCLPTSAVFVVVEEKERGESVTERLEAFNSDYSVKAEALSAETEVTHSESEKTEKFGKSKEPN